MTRSHQKQNRSNAPYNSGSSMEKVPEIEICMLNSEDVTSVEGEAVSTRCRKAGLGPKIEIPIRIGNVNAVALLDCGLRSGSQCNQCRFVEKSEKGNAQVAECPCNAHQNSSWLCLCE